MKKTVVRVLAFFLFLSGVEAANVAAAHSEERCFETVYSEQNLGLGIEILDAESTKNAVTVTVIAIPDQYVEEGRAIKLWSTFGADVQKMFERYGRKSQMCTLKFAAGFKIVEIDARTFADLKCRGLDLSNMQLRSFSTGLISHLAGYLEELNLAGNNVLTVNARLDFSSFVRLTKLVLPDVVALRNASKMKLRAGVMVEYR